MRTGTRNRKLMPYLLILGFMGLSIILLMPGFISHTISSNPPHQTIPEKKHNFDRYSFGVSNSESHQVIKINNIKMFIENFLRDNTYGEDTANELGQILYTNGFKDLAIGVLEKALWENPSDVAVLILLGTIYGDLGKIGEFAPKWKYVLERIPDNLEIYENLASFFIERSEIEQAIAILELGVEQNPHHDGFLLALGDHLSVQSRYQEAIELYRTAIQLNPHSASNYFKLGEIYLELGETDLSKHFFEIASQKSEDF